MMIKRAKFLTYDNKLLIERLVHCTKSAKKLWNKKLKNGKSRNLQIRHTVK